MNSKLFCALLLLVAFLLRLAVVAAVQDMTEGPKGISSADDVQFDTYATHLAEGKGYTNREGKKTSFRAPGFPLFLAAVYAIAGIDYPVAYVSFCFLGAIACVLTYLLARELLEETPARYAGMLLAIYVPHIYFATTFISENLFVPSLTLTLLLFVRYLKSGHMLPLLVAGFAVGVTSLTRPFAVLLVPVLTIVLLCHHWSAIPRIIRDALLFGLAVSVVMTPWMIRNYAVHDRFVAFTTNGGSTFYGGNNDLVATVPQHFGYWVPTTELPHRAWIDAQPNEVAHDKMEWKLGFDWIRNHPRLLPQLLFFKLARMWWLPEIDAASRLIRAVSYLPFLVLIFAGIVRVLRTSTCWTTEWWTLHAAFLVTLLVVLIFCGLPRFRDGSSSVLMVYAAFGLSGIVQKLSSRLSSRSRTGSPRRH